MSPGWQSKALQIASRVENRMAFAFPFFSIDKLAMVIPTLFARLVTLIFLFASMTSILIVMAITVSHTVKSFSDFMFTAFWRIFSKAAAAVAIMREVKLKTIPSIVGPAESSPCTKKWM